MMGLCKNCKHWYQDKEDFLQIVGANICNRAKQFWDSTEWEQRTVERDGWDQAEVSRVRKDADDLHFVQDGSDYSARLITLPEFGCVQFEAKE